MERKIDIISAGLMVYDILVSPVDENLFKVDTTHIDSINYKTGGDALNVALDAAKLGAKVCMGGVVGDDMPGRFLREEAQKAGVDTSGIVTSKENQSSVSVVLCREDGQRFFAYYGKANNEFDGTGISDELLADAKLLYIGSMMSLRGMEGEPLYNLFARAKAKGTMTAMDTTWPKDGIWMPKLEKALPYCDVFIPSMYEAKELCGTDKPEEIVAFLHSKGVRIAGVKLGKEGVFIEDFYMPAFNCDKVIDTTGAGDAFMGGFLTGITQGKSLYDAALLGSATSNICIREIGAVSSALSMEKAEETIEKFKNGTLN
ncbi:MAG: carbohydrate kinase family protein [Ruminococcaceae bacterium]|nr:carbohydrate kinase family protein [Oscillospiraceae bacterium]